MRLLDGFRVGDRVLEVVVASLEGRSLLGEQRLDDAQRFAQASDPVVEALKPVHLVFDLRPRGADAELQPPAGQMIDGHGLLGEERRVAIGVARHKAADPDSLGRLGHRGLERPAFVDRAVGPAAADRGEVVEVPYVVEARFFSDSPYRAQVRDGRVLTGVLEPETEGMSHAVTSVKVGWL